MTGGSQRQQNFNLKAFREWTEVAGDDIAAFAAPDGNVVFLSADEVIHGHRAASNGEGFDQQTAAALQAAVDHLPYY